jgi:hypothetical protein
MTVRGQSRTRGIPALLALLALVVTGCAATGPGPTVSGTPTPGDPSAAATQLAASAGAASVDVEARVTGDDDASSAGLIDAARAAGDIDEPTALAYRLWAQLGAPELPEQFRGARNSHDVALASRAQAALEDASADVQELLAPYLLRPANPESAFSSGGAPGFRRAGHAATGPLPRADEQSAAGPHRCASGWTSEATPGLPFRVWACTDMPDGGAADAIATVRDALARLDDAGIFATPPRGLGLPTPDDPTQDPTPGSDDLVDIYLLPDGWMAPYRESNERTIDAHAAAITMPAAPRTATSTSGYTMLGAYLLDHPEALAGVLAHEITHLQQFAHVSIDAGVNSDSGWFYEATADWARGRYVPEFATGYLPDLQNSALSLHDPDWRHGYAAAFWPLYMEQQLGPESIVAVWQSMVEVPADSRGGAAVAAINQQMNVQVAFAEFVLRLVNADLPGDPATPRFNEIDPQIPDGLLPEMPVRDIAERIVTIDSSGIPGLGYRFHRFTLTAPGGIGSVEIASDAHTATGTPLTIDALVRDPDGSYQRVSVEADGTTVCTGGDIILAVSNSSLVIEDAIAGFVTIAPTDDPGCSGAPPAADIAGGVDQAAACDALRELSLRAGRYADLALLPVTAEEVRADFDAFTPYYSAFPDELTLQVLVVRHAADTAAEQPAETAATILDDADVRAASDYIAGLYGRECHD